MKNFVKKASNWIAGFMGVTISGANFALESADVSVVTSGIGDGIRSLFSVLLQLRPILLGLVIAFGAYRFVKGLAKRPGK